MREAILTVVIAALGFLVGVMYSMVSLPAGADAPLTTDARLVTKLLTDIANRHQEFLGKLDQVANEVRRIERRSRSSGGSDAIVAQAGDSALPTVAAQAASGGNAPAASPTATGAETSRPRGDRARLAELERWKDDSRVRDTWLLKTEREVVNSFGNPDQIGVDSAGEWWTYGKPDASGNGRFHRIRMANGRVVDFAGGDGTEGGSRR